MSTYPKTSSRKDDLRLICGIAGILIGLIGATVGILGVFGAANPGSSGEWAGLGILFTYVIAIPAGLFTALMAIFAKNKSVRIVCVVLALMSLGLPFGSSYVRMKRSE